MNRPNLERCPLDSGVHRDSQWSAKQPSRVSRRGGPAESHEQSRSVLYDVRRLQGFLGEFQSCDTGSWPVKRYFILLERDESRVTAGRETLSILNWIVLTAAGDVHRKHAMHQDGGT